MSKGTRKLANGKFLGDQTKDSLKQILSDAGWNVFTAASTQSSPHVRITTLGATKGGSRLAVHLFEFEEPDWRRSRFKALKAEQGRVVFEDGDYLLQVSVRTGGKPDGKLNQSVLAAIVGS